MELEHLVKDADVDFLNKKIEGYLFQGKIIFNSNNALFVAFQRTKNTEVNEKTQRYAIKAYRYQTDIERERLDNEIHILQLFSNDSNIISYDGWFDLLFKKIQHRFIVMKYYDNLDLFDICVREQVFYNLPEEDCRYIAYQGLKILKLLKEKHIVHHDIKLDNFLILSKSPIKLLLSDFEYAEILTYDASTQFCGTPYIRAPEVLAEIPHDYAADMWSFGIVLHQILYGFTPFELFSECYDKNQLLWQIQNNPLERPETDPDEPEVSLSAWECVSSMLTIDPNDRTTAEKALKLDWFNDISDELIDTKAKVSAVKDETNQYANLTKDEKGDNI